MANPLIAIFNPITTLIDQIPSVSIGPAAPGIPVVTNLNGVVDSSLLGVGSLALAGETIAAGQLVNIYSASGQLHAQVADAKGTGTAPSGDPYPLQAQGFANSNAVIGGQLTVNFSGTFKYIDGASEFTAANIGQEVYLASSAVAGHTPGGITLSPPVTLEEAVGYVVGFTAPSTVTVSFVAGFQDFTHISGVNPISKGGTGATTGAQALLNLIAGSPATGQALVFNGTNWVPGSTSFQYIATGTNTAATMTVGTGASIVVTGTGAVQATQIQAVLVSSAAIPSAGQVLTATSATTAVWQTPAVDNDGFDQITSGTNTTAVMVVGTGATLTVSGTGVIEATELATSGSPVVINGTAPSAASQALVTTNTTTATWQTIVPVTPSDHPGQVATLGPVTLVASVPTTGNYRISFYEECTVAGNSSVGQPFGSGVFGASIFGGSNDDQLQTTITWTDDVTSRNAFPCPTLDLGGTNAISGELVIRAAAASAITFTSTLLATGTPTYGVFARVEPLS